MDDSSNSEENVDFGPVDDFVRYESLSRFEPVYVPVNLLDWEHPADRVTSASTSSSEEGGTEETEESSPKERRRSMIETLWARLFRFYHENGYRELQALQHALEDRVEQERRRNRTLSQRARYGAFLEERMCIPAIQNEAPISERREGVSFPIDGRRGLRCRVEGSGRNRVIYLRPSKRRLQSAGISSDHLSDWPFRIEGGMERDPNLPKPKAPTWGRARGEVNRYSRQMNRQFSASRDALDLTRVRHLLAKMMLWQIEVGGKVREAPSLEQAVVEEMLEQPRRVLESAMILRICPHLQSQRLTQRELADRVSDCYSEDQIGIAPKSFVQGAASLVRDISPEYEEFSRDFVRELKRMDDLIREAAGLIEENIPEPNCPDRSD